MTQRQDAPHATGLNQVQGIVRLLLELAALASLAWWGWHLGSETWQQVLLASAMPIVAAIIWAIFRTAGQSGKVAVPGTIRLGIELAFFLLAAYGLWTSGARIAAETLLTFAALHYILTWNRVRWLVRN